MLGGLAGALLAALAAFLLARALSRPMRRVAEASRRVGADLVPEHVPERASPSCVRSRARSTRWPSSCARARRRARVPPLRLARAEDAADCDPRLCGGARRRSVSVEDAVGDDPARGGPARTARPRPARPRAHEQGRVLVHTEPIDLGEVAGEVVRRYEQEARAFEVTLEAQTNGAAPASADPDRVLQVVSNLVENALRLARPEASSVSPPRPASSASRTPGPGSRPTS